MGDITQYNVALFLHVSVVIVGFMIAAVLHVGLNVMVRSKTVEEAHSWGRVVHRLEPLLPVSALLILVFGAWLIGASHKVWHWGDGWILTAVIALIVIEGLAGALLAPHSKKLVAAIEEAGNGPMSPALRSQAMDPVIWDLAHVATFGFLGVVFVMTNKPSGVGAVIVVVIGAIVGVALSRWQLALAAKATGTAASAAGASSPATP
ncbi:MAG TPA: hypothetical protein VHD58_10395 [Mycobacteriales bacterium]|jgi:hypothetical protein|nr:hypothetical protein [Mycobacteriales bacterium]